MKILAIWPPHVPTYFNEGHRMPMFMLAAYLRRQGHQVSVMDAGALNCSWKDVANFLADESFDVVAVMNEYGNPAAVGQLCEYVRRLSPKSKTITYGRLSSQVPGFFTRYKLDAVVASGDFEAGVEAYVNALEAGRVTAPGVTIRDGLDWSTPEPGVFLDAEAWAFPDVSDIPYEAYDRLYLDDSRKFCGVPERRELVVPVARGCPVGCSFCEVPRQQGLKERRRSVEAVLGYIEDSFERFPFEYVSFYAPTFTLRKDWVKRLADALIERGAKYPWKCVTTVHHLEPDLVALMAKSGCVRISIGLETLDPPAQRSLPKIKNIEQTTFRNVADWCRGAGVELNCFVILGLPGQSVEGARYTIDQVRAVGARVRPTIYTPYERLTAEMDEATVLSYDRQFFVDGSMPVDDEAALYALAFGTERNKTRVMNKIPSRAPAAL